METQNPNEMKIIKQNHVAVISSLISCRCCSSLVLFLDDIFFLLMSDVPLQQCFYGATFILSRLTIERYAGGRKERTKVGLTREKRK